MHLWTRNVSFIHSLEWCLDVYKTLNDWHDTLSIWKYFSELQNDSNKKKHNQCYVYTYLNIEKPTFCNCHCGSKNGSKCKKKCSHMQLPWNWWHNKIDDFRKCLQMRRNCWSSEDSGLLVYDAVSLDELFLTFRRDVIPSSFRIKRCHKPLTWHNIISQKI
jgi:hypothetical protein